MEIIMAGAGEAGITLAAKLSLEGHNVTVIDQDSSQLTKIVERLDISCVCGNAASPKILKEANIKSADMFIAVTDSDEVNILSCALVNTLAEKSIIRIARIRDSQLNIESNSLGSNFLSVDLQINPEHKLVESLLNIVEVPGAVDVSDFFDGQLRLVGLKIFPNHKLVNSQLSELRTLSQKEFLIAAIYRDNNVIIPSGQDKIIGYDSVYLFAKKNELHQVMLDLGFSSTTTRSLTICGSGLIAVDTATALLQKGINVRMIIKNQKEAEKIAAKLPKVVVLQGDITDEYYLKNEGIDTQDLFISATEEDEVNIMSALLAKKMGVSRVIAVTKKTSYLSVVANLGIDLVLSQKGIVIGEILQFIRRGALVSAYSISESKAEAIEVLLEHDLPEIMGNSLKNNKLPKGILVGGVARAGSTSIAKGDDILKIGDRIILFYTADTINMLDRFI